MGDSKAEFCRKWREAFRRMQEARRKEEAAADAGENNDCNCSERNDT